MKRGIKIALYVVAISGMVFACHFLTGCSNGQYTGPRFNLQAGYDGVSMGITVFGTNSPLKPSSSPSPSPSSSTGETSDK